MSAPALGAAVVSGIAVVAMALRNGTRPNLAGMVVLATVAALSCMIAGMALLLHDLCPAAIDLGSLVATGSGVFALGLTAWLWSRQQGGLRHPFEGCLSAAMLFSLGILVTDLSGQGPWSLP
jgi:hypothetical protein